ncbi:MAG: histidine triad nucleotide-binding protein [Gammaproteobacteria bacterium]
MSTEHDCLFCGIIEGRVPSEKVYEDDLVYAFRDINPQAPVHVLVIPKTHISTINHIEPGHEALVGRLFTAAQTIAEQQGVKDSGYRVTMNCGEDALQSVYHIHLHLLGGRLMKWPPG